MDPGRAGDAGLLAAAIAEYQNGHTSIDDVMGAFYRCPRVRRLVTSACFKGFGRTGVSDQLVNDVRQDLAILLCSKFIHSIKDVGKIYNVLHVAAGNVVRGRRAKKTELSIGTFEAEDEDGPYDLLYLQSDHRGAIAAHESIMDRDKAVAEFNRRSKAAQAMQNNQDHQTSRSPGVLDSVLLNRLNVDVRSPPLEVPRRKKIRRRVISVSASKGGQRLREIKNLLGLPVSTFATSLGIPVGTLSSYLYGTVNTVPESVLECAEELLATHGKSVERLKRKFDDMGMVEIFASWVKLLNIQDMESNSQQVYIGEDILGVSRVTIWRWLNRDMRPDIHKLNRYDEIVRNKAVEKRNAEKPA